RGLFRPRAAFLPCQEEHAPGRGDALPGRLHAPGDGEDSRPVYFRREETPAGAPGAGPGAHGEVGAVTEILVPPGGTLSTFKAPDILLTRSLMPRRPRPPLFMACSILNPTPSSLISSSVSFSP